MLKQFIFGSAFISSVSANIGLLLLRIIAGLSMAFAHGMGKIPPSEGFIAGVAEMGFPAAGFFSWMAGISEFIGGMFLVVGFLTRPSALLMGITMSVAVFVRHASDPFATQEKAVLYLGICLLFVLVGSGKYGVDGFIGEREGKLSTVSN